MLRVGGSEVKAILKESLDAFHIDPETNELLSLYRRTKQIYFHTQEVLGKTPRIEMSYSSTKEIEVSNGAQLSTKIYTAK